MKCTMRRCLALLLAVVVLSTVSFTGVLAAGNDGYDFKQLGEKTAESLVKPGQYEITVSVPGAVATDEYSEVIVMVDASSSQGSNLTKLKTMLVNLAEDILHNDGSMRLTLMGFGMGPRNVGSFYNAETLEDYLQDVTQSDLRQGVSATNCEASLEFVHEYIRNSQKLHKTVVLYTSDGNCNMDEIEFSLSEWVEHPEWYMKGATVADVAYYAFAAQAEVMYADGTVFSGTAALYPDDALAVTMARTQYGQDSEEFDQAVSALNEKIMATEEAQIAYVNALWADVFAYSGLTFDSSVGYSTSRLEKAFLDFYSGALTNSYLVSIHGMKNAGVYTDDYQYYRSTSWGARAADAADALANDEKVLELYMIDFSSNTNTWMNPGSTVSGRVTSDKIIYQKANNYSVAVDKIQALADEMFSTVYQDATVVDPMSKWVTLDPSSIRIYEDDLLIYEYGEGWLYEDKQPAEDPITLTKDENGRYTITWRIKDGPLLYTDRYFLKYIVDTDETAEGFQYDTEYPANDPTRVEYLDVNGEKQVSDIPVPEVVEMKQPENFDEGEQGFKIYKSASGRHTPISGITFNIYQVIPGENDVVNLVPTEEEIAKYAVEANLIGTITTNSYGYAYFNLTENGYGDGRYLLVEQPNDKVKEPVAPFYITMPYYDAETGEASQIVSIYPKNELVETEEPPLEPEIPDEPDQPEKGKVTILKHEVGKLDVVLEGAQFQVYRLAEADETPVLNTTYNDVAVGLIPVMLDGEAVIIESDENGHATTPSLDYGLYFLVEVQAPNGYNLLQEPVAVYVTPSSQEPEHVVPVANMPGALLPETGGPGTAAFTVLGTLLCCAAIVLFMLNRRRSAMI